MSDISNTDAYYDKVKKDFDRYLELGEYLKEQGQLDEAIEKFLLGFEQYAELTYIVLAESKYHKNETKIGSFFTLYNLLNKLFYCFAKYEKIDSEQHSNIICYLLRSMKMLKESMMELESSFTADDIKTYHKICISLKESELLAKLSLGKSINEQVEKVENLIKSTKPDKTADDTLKKLRTSLSTISETSFFPKFESNGGGCFIATAAYSTSIHPDLDTFRKFRDRSLLSNPLGRLLVSVYYQIGPQIAQYVNRSLYVKKIVRLLLEKLASFMRSRP